MTQNTEAIKIKTNKFDYFLKIFITKYSIAKSKDK